MIKWNSLQKVANNLSLKDLEDVLLEKVVVDVDSEDNMNYIANVINKWSEN